MIVNWMRKKVQKMVLKSAQQEITRFVSSLRVIDDKEVGMLVGIATIIRMNLDEHGYVSGHVFNIESSMEAQAQAEEFLLDLIKRFQKRGQRTDAAGAMVWLHTLRAFTSPETITMGREMWKELSRGFPHVKDSLERIKGLKGNSIPTEAYRECLFIPPGLEPCS